MSTGVLAGCLPKIQIDHKIDPQIQVKSEPTLKKEWFKIEKMPLIKVYDARGQKIDGETFTCFSPADSKELAIEILDLRAKLEIMNNRMGLLYERYYNEKMPLGE